MTISGTSSYAPLDRELIDQYSLVVTVNDGGLSISHNFDVLLLDVNDEIPELNKDTYIVASELIENSIDGSLLLSLFFVTIISISCPTMNLLIILVKGCPCFPKFHMYVALYM